MRIYFFVFYYYKFFTIQAGFITSFFKLKKKDRGNRLKKVRKTKIEKFGLSEKVNELAQSGYTQKKITEECNKILPTNVKLSEASISYYLAKQNTNLKAQDQDYDYSKIEDKIWQLVEKAELLMGKAEQQIDADPYLFDKSIRSCNEVIKTAIQLMKEVKKPAATTINNKQETLQLLINFTINLEPKMKNAIIEEAKKYLEENIQEV